MAANLSLPLFQEEGAAYHVVSLYFLTQEPFRFKCEKANSGWLKQTKQIYVSEYVIVRYRDSPSLRI